MGAMASILTHCPSRIPTEWSTNREAPAISVDSRPASGGRSGLGVIKGGDVPLGACCLVFWLRDEVRNCSSLFSSAFRAPWHRNRSSSSARRLCTADKFSPTPRRLKTPGKLSSQPDKIADLLTFCGHRRNQCNKGHENFDMGCSLTLAAGFAHHTIRYVSRGAQFVGVVTHLDLTQSAINTGHGGTSARRRLYARRLRWLGHLRRHRVGFVDAALEDSVGCLCLAACLERR